MHSTMPHELSSVNWNLRIGHKLILLLIGSGTQSKSMGSRRQSRWSPYGCQWWCAGRRASYQTPQSTRRQVHGTLRMCLYVGLECRLLSVMVCWKKRVIPKSTVYKQTSTWNITHVFLGLGCRNWRLLILCERTVLGSFMLQIRGMAHLALPKGFLEPTTNTAMPFSPLRRTHSPPPTSTSPCLILCAHADLSPKDMLTLFSTLLFQLSS